VNRFCAACGSPLFENRRSNAIYCSRECNNRIAIKRYRESQQPSRSTQSQIIKCANDYCGEQLSAERIAHRAKYCSNECRNNAYNFQKKVLDSSYHKSARRLRQLERAEARNEKTLALIADMIAGVDTAMRDPLLEANALRHKVNELEDAVTEAVDDLTILANTLHVLTKRTHSVLAHDVAQVVNKWISDEAKVA